MSPAQTIHVYWDHRRRGAVPALMGILSVQLSRGKELFAFSFEKEWLKNNPVRNLDPDLQLYAGPQYASKPNFGLFMDSAPDRWGRTLMQRRAAMQARQAGQASKPLTETDYLLGVYDQTRMGALRFKTSPDGAFLHHDSALAAPPWARLRELEEACRHLEEDRDYPAHEKWLVMLLAPGSSLGGARPKASVTDPAGNLWIAKFPSRQDQANTAAWEFVAMQMAREAGIQIPECRLEQFSRFGSTFLARRFDREGDDRIHFASAMTLLGKNEGANAQDGSTYLELAEFITRYGARPQQDLTELWRRIVFSIAISNTDDHLRNHGFLLTASGWTLSPAYDLNPNPQRSGLALNITESDNALDFALAEEVAPLFRLSSGQAGEIIQRVRGAVSHWRQVASRAGIGRSEQEGMQNAFRVAE
ncbi:MAG: type II toxin-antitoxin system HipA family toxin [Victivallaceae bacterium]